MCRARSMPSYLLFAACLFLAAGSSSQVNGQAPGTTEVTVFEGARLITGDGNTIENSSFIVENNRFTSVGRRVDVQVPRGAARVDLTGKTVMPTMVDLHGHIGFQNVAEGTMSKETFTRENLIDHLQRLAYHGVGAIVGIGDLVSRSDLRGGRTNWGDVPLRVRDEAIPNAALFKTAGAGTAWPGAGAQGHPSRADVMYPATRVEVARRPALAGELFSPTYPGVLGRSADEDDAGSHRARPQKSRVGWQQCDEAQSGGHADRHGDRHRAEPFFYWLFQPHGFGKLCCDRHDAGRGDCRGDARFGGNREGEFRDGGAGQERRFHRPRRQSYREHCQHATDHQGLSTGTGSPPRRDDGEVAGAVPHRIDAIDHIGTQTCR